jgi:hypothetical protein
MLLTQETQPLHETAITKYPGHQAHVRGTAMADIFFAKALNKFDDYATASVYFYKDDMQQFFFDCQFTETVSRIVKDGIIVEPSRYSVLVSKIGKTDAVSSTTKPVQDLDECKAEIAKYFRTHPLDVAKTLPDRVIFA